MTLQEVVEKGVAAAKEIGDILQHLFRTLYNTDIEVIGKYVLILVIGGLLLFGLRLLSDELEEYRVRKQNKSEKLPWYLRDWALFLAIIFLYTLIFTLIL